MNYFIGRGIDNLLTGIEQAQINRLKLFKKNQIPAQIISFNYSRDTHKKAAVYGLDKQDLCNMFDYYQQSRLVNVHALTVASVRPKGTESELVGFEQDLAAVNCVKNRHVVCQIRYIQLTGQVQQVLWTNQSGKIDHTDSYDERGFFARRSWLDLVGNIKLETYYTPAGKEAITIKYRNYEKLDTEKIKLASGETFDSFNDLKNDFLQKLDAEEISTFFLDREFDPVTFRDMNLAGKRISVIHNAHVGYEETMATEVNKIAEQAGKKERFKPALAYYDRLLQHPGNIDAFLVSTEAQKKDIQKSYPDTKPVFVVPVGFNLNLPSPIELQRRDLYQVIIVSRISPEKGISDAIAAFISVWKQVPQARLVIYGGANGEVSRDYLKQMNEQIIAAGAQNAIRFAGFRHNLKKMYDRSGLFVMTSHSESFNLSMQEALSHGVPVLAYDIKYGPSDMISNGSNGVLVKPNDVNELTVQMKRLLSQPQLLGHMSDGAYRLRKKYSGEIVWRDYQQVIAFLDNQDTVID
ncbi:glycosyltransferase [Pediococcus ethanolidurans]|uniref:Glycosyl transferases group 1 n=1 Tax=Pediococcus ethanolidurans TaxID=319653 RepID=A0A0R2K106_9LACO|nr:glycosyltransferase [Pediococcus ethanolidurans]KRN83035.1 hypothetical protein IV87_GL001745 [Pediococcus ethanolidurans]GEN94187.1 poly(glycerol-phosphate) alpha-glucosyltransferase [Pediococcus ethanolidurans]SER08045.1 Glycosyl transferases group 1 [Pediococcus ethanolidurans]